MTLCAAILTAQGSVAHQPVVHACVAGVAEKQTAASCLHLDKQSFNGMRPAGGAWRQ